MFITVTDEGMTPHEYSKSCKCRGCVAVRKAKRRAAWIAFPVVLLTTASIGFFAGPTLGVITGIASSIIAVAIFTSLSPSSEVLKPDPEDSDGNMAQAPSGNTTTREAKTHWGWNVAVALGGLAAFGAFFAVFIPAYAGVRPSNPYDSIGIIFWFGLLGYFLRKKCGLSGGRGWLIGGAVGLVVAFGGSFLYGYQKARLQNEADLAEAQEKLATMNAELPQMVDEYLRADRIDFHEDEMQYFLTFVDETAEELAVDETLSEYQEFFVSGLCETVELEESLAAGVGFHYFIVDKNDAPVMEFTITQADCQ